MGIKGAFATKSPSGANIAQEKSKRSLIFVDIDVCRNDRPIASAMLMKRLAKSARRIGSAFVDSAVFVIILVLLSEFKVFKVIL